jgi:hypothetical protein
MMQENEYDTPAVSTFSYFGSKDSQDVAIDLLNDMGLVLKEKKLLDKDVRLAQRKKLAIRYNDYSKKYPTIKYSERWIDDGKCIAGVHPNTYLPFFLNSTGSTICRLCEGKMDIDGISGELNRIFPSVDNHMLLKDLLSFLLLLEEMDLMEFNR